MKNPGKHNSPLVRIFLIVAGSVSVLLGVLGIILPVVPTTPFLLLAAFFYARSSEQLYNWLMHHRIWGRYLQDYTSGKGVPLLVKIWALTLLWATILSTVFCVVDKIWIQILLIAVAAAVSIHILNIRTLRKNQ
ncbi:MAG: YbaN family protein [Bacteroidales bacterium]|nr:YbaN family protein [Bacteroidales bacterium]